MPAPSAPWRVLRIINRLNVGGPTFNASYLSRYLPAPEFETQLVSGMLDEGEANAEYVATGLGVQPRYVQHMHRSIHPRQDYLAYRELYDIIREYKPHIVHTHAAKPGLAGRLAAWRAGVPVIVHTYHGHYFHSYFSPLKTRVFLQLERWLATRSSAIVAISAQQKYEIGSVYHVCPPDKITVVKNGFDLDRFAAGQDAMRAAFRSQWGLADDDVAVGIVARITGIKNHGLYLDAIAAARQLPGGQHIRGVIIGDGELRQQTEARAAELGLLTPEAQGRTPVIFTSWIQDMPAPMAGLDVVALTSLNEGTPVCIVEAGAAARPVVATRVGGVEDTVQDGQGGLLSPTEDAPAMAANLARLAADAKLRQQMGLAGREFAFQNFGYQRLANDMAALYRSLLAQAQQQGRIRS